MLEALEWISELLAVGGLVWHASKLHSRVERHAKRLEAIEYLLTNLDDEEEDK